MMLTESLLSDFLIIALSLLIVLISYCKWQFSYWKRRNLQYIEPTFPWGNIDPPGKQSIGVSVQHLYEKMKKKNFKHAGMYMLTNPTYIVLDPDLIKNVLAKDFQYFVDRGIYYNEKDEPISAHLFAIGGVKWRNLRSKLTPTFTSGKMKMMFQTLLDCRASLEEKVKIDFENKKPVDIKDVLGCFTTDIIGSCAFGLECNTFKDDDSPFRKYGKKVFQSDLKRKLQTMVSLNFPTLAKTIRLTQIPKDVSDFFTDVVVKTVDYREKNNVTRNDFMQLLIDLKNNKLAHEEGYHHDGKTLTIGEITAQSFIFFLAGFETSSTTMTFALYELAKNQDIQQKLREEINTVLSKYDGQVTYEAIHEMKYMQQVLDETLRKYPPVPFITRKCIKDYKVQNEDLVIEEGTRVIIPILGLHRDEEFYPDPDKFDPERFSPENSKSRHQYTYIPFGEGPRICIGLRFGFMQSKVGLTCLLSKYKFTLNKKMPENLKFAIDSFILAAEGDVWLDAKPI